MNDKANKYQEFLLLLNSDAIITYIIQNKKCILNRKQIDFIKAQKIEVGNPIPFLDELENINISIDELLEEYNTITPKYKKKSKKSKKSYNKNQKSCEIQIVSSLQKAKNGEQKSRIVINRTNNNKEIVIDSQIEIKNTSEVPRLNDCEKNLKGNFNNSINYNEKIFENNTIINENKEHFKVNNNNFNNINNKVFNDDILKNKKNISTESNQKLHEEINEMKTKLEKFQQELAKEKSEKNKLKQKIEQLENNLEKERDERKLESDNLNNKIDICQCNIGMICYRDLIKDIINYCFDYLHCIKDENDSLGQKVYKIQKSLTLKNKTFTENEIIILSNFIYTSYKALKNVNFNVHEGGYLSDYSIPNFIKCLKNYIQLYEYEILKINKKKNDVHKIRRGIIQKPKDIENILTKIGFKFKNDLYDSDSSDNSDNCDNSDNFDNFDNINNCCNIDYNIDDLDNINNYDHIDN